MTPPAFGFKSQDSSGHPSAGRGVSDETRLLVLREREREQRAALAGPELPGQEALGPGAPAGRHGDVLPAVDAVGARARVVAAAALELPEQVAGVGVEGVELTRGLSAEDEPAARRQQGRAHRD